MNPQNQNIAVAGCSAEMDNQSIWPQRIAQQVLEAIVYELNSPRRLPNRFVAEKVKLKNTLRKTMTKCIRSGAADDMVSVTSAKRSWP